ncbi:hypothetical protein CEUSTIGMA_g9090.t1 [Chlamydomonas eustigma]|uniref:Uncharacterized protein n=1 Tax=Chlamydomonas eustigma TaxID=1157962 RepID=A0A250XFI0_9CHLO|nr:hypothetical protein CEUSTIGMA_g9090.t1 [Chlamydomonas eustigma]|eukprot:GAX81662.1 hypothetical protein CEUSTIGMA_g9090.t1 [Chlamydomonas eustigma]
MVATRNRAKRTGSQDDNGPSTSQPSSPIRLNSSRKGKRASKPTETPQIHLDEEYILAPASEVKTDNMKPMIQAASAAALSKQEEESRQHLDSFHRHSQLRSALDVLLKAVSDPTVLLQPNQDLTSSARNSAMAMYKFSLQNLLSSCSKGEAKALKEGPQPVLLELYAGEGFDAEQVWLQLDTATNATLRQVRRLLSRAGIGSGASSVLASGMIASTTGGPEALVKPEYQEHIDALIQEEEEGGEDDEEEEEDEEEEQLQSLEEDSEHSEEGEEEDNDLDFDEDEGQEPVQNSGGRRKADRSRKAGGLKGRSNDEDGFPSDWPHPVEDRFMKLSEMERFLEDAEAKQAHREGGEGAEEEEQDYLNGEYEGDEGEEDEGGNCLLTISDGRMFPTSESSLDHHHKLYSTPNCLLLCSTIM